MKRVLVTGGTVFVSRFVATYYVEKGYEVYVLNRNTKEQVKGVKLIEVDRNNIRDKLKNLIFDVIFDITSYTKNDAENLIKALGQFKDYIFISSSAIYSDNALQPFKETQQGGYNKVWKKYGTDKYEAEKYILSKVPQAYILRPPYFYGPMQNLYREPFVFQCALKERKFYLPNNGQMKLQFFYVEDLCKFMDVLLEVKPKEHIFNVGNKETITIKEWVELCYKVANRKLKFVNVNNIENQRNYFCFHDYEYELDVTNQLKYFSCTKSILDGLKESFEWYVNNKDKVKSKEYIKFIDNILVGE